MQSDYRLGLLAGLAILACCVSYFAGQRSGAVAGTALAADGCQVCDCSSAVVALPSAVSAASAVVQ